jgi:serine/threonine protein phosphatase PrpC
MDLVTPLEPSPVRGKRPPRENAATTRHAVRLTRWVRLELAAASARGRRREVNEDSHSALNGSAPLFVVADGVGGGVMAARASRELVHRLHDALDDHRIDAGRIRDAVLHADREVGRSIASHTQGAGAATVALCAGTGMLLSRWLIAWVGDCRVYRVSARREEPAQLLTVDDTYGHLSEVPPPGGSRDDPARMVGNGAVSSPNVDQVALRGGDMLVLCSDGIHKHVEPRELSQVLHGSAPLARRCGRLLALARAHGSRDDATVLVVRREPRHARLALLVAGSVLIVALLAALLVTAERGFRVSPVTSAPSVDAAPSGATSAGQPDAQRPAEAREP